LFFIAYERFDKQANNAQKWKKLSAKTPAGRAARGGKERGNPPTQPRPAFSFVSERLVVSWLSVVIKCSEPAALI
jgi:hypothetical protein